MQKLWPTPGCKVLSPQLKKSELTSLGESLQSMRRLITNVLKSDNSAFKPKTHVKFAEAATTTRKTVRKYKTTKMLGRISR